MKKSNCHILWMLVLFKGFLAQGGLHWERTGFQGGERHVAWGHLEWDLNQGLPWWGLELLHVGAPALTTAPQNNPDVDSFMTIHTLTDILPALPSTYTSVCFQPNKLYNRICCTSSLRNLQVTFIIGHCLWKEVFFIFKML